MQERFSEQVYPVCQSSDNAECKRLIAYYVAIGSTSSLVNLYRPTNIVQYCRMVFVNCLFVCAMYTAERALDVSL